ncbi:hypothetical protein [Niabella hibiscisoli]|uniref:hypothetical protein n=1 Tax=Niabella hibiscisoli TaxID=1825928 RepID=UPI001F0D631D|nr:hypothetical protein [Niabella hibiscisoli]MCH5717151.1 hypothetical protein [Niabella hibiscisoli]
MIGVGGKVEADNKKLHHYFDRLININPPGISLAKALRNTKANLIKTGKKIGQEIKTGSFDT